MSSALQVLIIEDDESIRELVYLTLSHEGYDVVTAPHGAAALDLVTNRQPDVILLDMCMPVMDGWEFSQAYSETPGPHAPIVVLTASHRPAFPASEIKADGYLAKPFELDDLVQLIQQYAQPSRIPPTFVFPIGDRVSNGP